MWHRNGGKLKTRIGKERVKRRKKRGGRLKQKKGRQDTQGVKTACKDKTRERERGMRMR